MEYEIKILCPGMKCGKCRRMLARVEQTVSETQAVAEIELITTIDEMMKYNTWILPTLVINNEIIARGAIPPKEVIITKLSITKIIKS